MSKSSEWKLSANAYVELMDAGKNNGCRICIGCNYTWDAGTVELTAQEARVLYGALKQLDDQGALGPKP